MQSNRHFIPVLFLLLVTTLIQSCSGCVGQCRELEGEIISSKVLGMDVPYSVVLPENYWKTDKSYPVLYLFHCIGGDSTTGIEYCNVTSVLDSLDRRGEIDPFIIVMPDIFLSYGADTYDGTFLYETMLKEELFPLIDNRFRTNGKRFSLGFSMGGFAAMSIALRNRDTFDGFVALSPSVRTDSQYAEEGPQEEWENQWGRIFGGIGAEGTARLTEYYKSYCPLHLLADIPSEDLDGFAMFIDVGNGEGGSLCESNECLHKVLLDRRLEHVWRVRAGGHEFSVWRQALPDAFRFISNSFEGKSYTARKFKEPARSAIRLKQMSLPVSELWIPDFGYATNRGIPAIYVFGANEKQRKDILEWYSYAYKTGSATPIAFSFISGNEHLFDAIRSVEQSCPILRRSQRMRSAICFGEAAYQLQMEMMAENLFTNVVFADMKTKIPAEDFSAAIRAQKRYPRIILATQSDSPEYWDSGSLHIALRNDGLSHQYYSYEKGSGPTHLHFIQWLNTINFKFHD